MVPPARAETPLSAIDWLSDTISKPKEADVQDQPVTTEDASSGEITVERLGQVTADAAGLIPVALSGLPPDLWANSRSSDIAQRLLEERVNLYPAMQDLLYLLVLSELQPPLDSDASTTLYLARIDTLLALGALDQAEALFLRTGTPTREIFRRAFDTSLLLRREDGYCRQLKLVPDLSPTFKARIFCLARLGDWNAAALTLETARALNYITPFEEELLVRFLDPEFADGAPPLDVPPVVTPLVFRLLEAIGEPVPTRILPRAFAHADLQANRGWKSQVEAAERLTRTAAIDANFLAGAYGVNSPAASGGVWNRVKAYQDLDNALLRGNRADVATALEPVWRAAQAVDIERAIASIFARRLHGIKLENEAGKFAARLLMLDGRIPAFGAFDQNDERLWVASRIMVGHMEAIKTDDPQISALIDGLTHSGIPVRLASLMETGRIGEAILRAMEMFETGTIGDASSLKDALQFFRAVGLEQFARDAAVQYLLLERFG